MSHGADTFPGVANRTVNDRQLEVLKWVVEGCPPRQWPDTTYKTSALALQNRRLVTVSKKGGVWRAVASDAGRYYVEHQTFPDGHWLTPKDKPAGAVDAPGSRAKAPAQKLVRSPSPTGRAAAAQLLLDLEAAGGVIEIEREEFQHYMRVARTMRATKGLLPEGKTVQLMRRDYYDWQVEIQDAPPPPEPLVPIPVAERLSTRPHQAVSRIGAEKGALDHLSRQLRPRVLRCLDALAKEAQRRGHEVEAERGGLKVTIRGKSHTIEFKEPSNRRDHVLTAEEQRRKDSGSYFYAPKWDYDPSGRLNATAARSVIAEPKPRADGSVAWQIEGRLAQVLDLVEREVAHAEARDQRLKEEAAERRRQWQDVHDQALVEYAEHHRGRALMKQAQRFAEVQMLDTYLAELTRQVELLTDVADQQAAGEWLAWARQYRASRDPFTRPPKMPKVPDPKGDELRPFMRGLSPSGPAY